LILTVRLLHAVRQAKLTLGALEKAIEYLVQKDIPLTREYFEAVDEQALEEELSEERARTDMQAEEKVTVGDGNRRGDCGYLGQRTRHAVE
jgi:hypothetical protein